MEVLMMKAARIKQLQWDLSSPWRVMARLLSDSERSANCKGQERWRDDREEEESLSSAGIKDSRVVDHD